MTKYVKLQCQI